MVLSIILPAAPAKISARMDDLSTFSFLLTVFTRYHPIAITATIRNKLSMSLPAGIPSFIPNAIPSFSMKCILNQLGITMYSWPINMCVLTQNLLNWSSDSINRIIRTGTKGLIP